MATVNSINNDLTNCTGLSLTTGVIGILSIANGGTNSSSVTTTPTASSFSGWDANSNLSANNFINKYTTTATAAGTTTLTNQSTYLQYFTGATTQTVVLPVTSTLALGFSFRIVNQSTGLVTVQSSGANNILIMPANTVSIFTCILTSGTTAASWDVRSQFNQIISSVILNSANTPFSTGTTVNLTSITLPSGTSNWSISGSVGLFGTTMTLIQGGLNTTSGTLPDLSQGIYMRPIATSGLGSVAVPTINLSLVSQVSTTPVYIVVQGTGTGSMTMWGSIIAQRIGN